MICRPPEQIKFEYHDSNSLLWLDKLKKNNFRFRFRAYLDLRLIGILHDVQLIFKHSWGLQTRALYVRYVTHVACGPDPARHDEIMVSFTIANSHQTNRDKYP